MEFVNDDDDDDDAWRRRGGHGVILTTHQWNSIIIIIIIIIIITFIFILRSVVRISDGGAGPGSRGRDDPTFGVRGAAACVQQRKLEG